MSKIEILAPAGGMDSLIAAVRCGADAVYFGGAAFNARRNAENFADFDDLIKAARYCKARGVKIYFTMNTIVFDNEIDDATEVIKRACAIGIDAFILQDLGLLKIIKRIAPDAKLHASTQMSVHTASGVKTLEKMGFSRVVLARELSSAEILEISENTSAELEVFVHGALCMSVSGQCYLSAMIGGRSGNRGACAQPCRLPFAADNGLGYDLSLKDLSLIKHMSGLTTGIKSLKIEGRMKRPEYVAASVTACREALEGSLSPQRLNQLQSIFSRSGFTDGYYTGRLGKDMFGYRQKEDVESSKNVLKELHALYKNEKSAIPVNFKFYAKSASPLKLIVSCDDVETDVVSSFVPEKASLKPLTAESAVAQLKKSGGTPFYIASVEHEIDDGLTVPLSKINEIRRTALNKLMDIKSEIKPIKVDCSAFKNNYVPAANKKDIEPKIYARFRDIENICDDLHMVDTLYIPVDADIDKIKMYSDLPCRVGVEIPRALFGREKEIRASLKKIRTLGINLALVGNIGGINLAAEEGYEIHGGLGLNISNSQAAEELNELGAEEFLLSFELTLAKARSINCKAKKGMIAYGYLPAMLTRNCPIKNGKSCKKCGGRGYLTDRRGEKFPVVCGKGYSEILNPYPLVMSDKIEELKGFDFKLYYFTIETPEETQKILNNCEKNHTPIGKFTRGLYYRGVE